MLAALVVLLLRDFFNGQSELRVVYIPDCSVLVQDILNEMRRSLLLAFADDDHLCQLIDAAMTIKQLEAFIQDRPYATMLFVVDQYNALTVHGGQRDRLISRKVEAEMLLSRCSQEQFIIRAVSINDDNRASVEKKQTNQQPLQLFGPLSPVSPALCTSYATVLQQSSTLTNQLFILTLCVCSA
jgi:hypothetical protein